MTLVSKKQRKFLKIGLGLIIAKIWMLKNEKDYSFNRNVYCDSSGAFRPAAAGSSGRLLTRFRESARLKQT